jgi:hypothetical protein
VHHRYQHHRRGKFCFGTAIIADTVGKFATVVKLTQNATGINYISGKFATGGNNI